MGNYATRTNGTIGLRRGDVVKAEFPGGKEQLAVVTKGVQARSETTTVVVTPLEKVNGESGNSKVIHVGEDSYAIQADKSRVCSKLRLRIDGGYVATEGHVSKREMSVVDSVLLLELFWRRENRGSRNDPKRGDVYWAELSGIGSEQTGRRPVIVLRSAGKDSQVLVAPLTTKMKKRMREHTVFVMKGRLNTALLESIRPVDRSCLFKKMGKVDKETMAKVICSLAACLALSF